MKKRKNERRGKGKERKKERRENKYSSIP